MRSSPVSPFLHPPPSPPSPPATQKWVPVKPSSSLSSVLQQPGHVIPGVPGRQWKRPEAKWLNLPWHGYLHSCVERPTMMVQGNVDDDDFNNDLKSFLSSLCMPVLYCSVPCGLHCDWFLQAIQIWRMVPCIISHCIPSLVDELRGVAAVPSVHPLRCRYTMLRTWTVLRVFLLIQICEWSIP